jgi:hypothetical protein
MSETTILSRVKTALRISSNSFDGELNDLIEACKLDLGIAGVDNSDIVAEVNPSDKLIILAIITFCKMNFGEPSESDKLSNSYNSLKIRLTLATGYKE